MKINIQNFRMPIHFRILKIDFENKEVLIHGKK